MLKIGVCCAVPASTSEELEARLWDAGRANEEHNVENLRQEAAG